jgi:hypothetical protein
VSGVLALALKRQALSRGTVLSAVPVGRPLDRGTTGTLGTSGTVGTLGKISDGDTLDYVAIEELAALAAVSVPPVYPDAWTQPHYHRPLSVTGFALLHPGRDGWSGEDWRSFFEERAAIGEFEGGVQRQQAAARAFKCCVAEWLNRNRMRSSPDSCLRCDEAEQGHDPLLPFGANLPAMPGFIRAAGRLGMPPDRPRPSPRFLRWVSRHEEITMSTKQTAANDLPF